MTTTPKPKPPPRIRAGEWCFTETPDFSPRQEWTVTPQDFWIVNMFRHRGRRPIAHAWWTPVGHRHHPSVWCMTTLVNKWRLEAYVYRIPRNDTRMLMAQMLNWIKAIQSGDQGRHGEHMVIGNRDHPLNGKWGREK